MEIIPLARTAEEILRSAKVMEKEKPMLMPREVIKAMREIAKGVTFGTISTSEIDLLDINLPLTLAKLYILPLLQPDEYPNQVLNYPIAPDYFAHHFVLGNRLLIVSCQEPIADHFIEYLFNMTIEVELYLDEFVGQEPLEKGINRIITPLRDELLQLMQYDDTEETE